jgi:hypothetical protein
MASSGEKPSWGGGDSSALWQGVGTLEVALGSGLCMETQNPDAQCFTHGMAGVFVSSLGPQRRSLPDPPPIAGFPRGVFSSPLALERLHFCRSPGVLTYMVMSCDVEGHRS